MMPTTYDRVAYHDEHGQRKREYVPWSHANRSDPDPGHLTRRENVATERIENDKNYIESGLNRQNHAVSDLNENCEQKHTGKAKMFTLIKFAHKTVKKLY